MGSGLGFSVQGLGFIVFGVWFPIVMGLYIYIGSKVEDLGWDKVFTGL